MLRTSSSFRITYFSLLIRVELENARRLRTPFPAISRTPAPDYGGKFTGSNLIFLLMCGTV
jgi:hypothetical protein